MSSWGNNEYGFLYNFLLLGPSLAWTPIYRLATITDITGALATVEYDEIKDEKGVVYSGNEPIDPIPFKYMSCGSSAFSVGDDVIVMFDGPNFENPTIIGFQSNPKECAKTGLCLTYSDVNKIEDGKFLVLQNNKFIETQLSLSDSLFPSSAGAALRKFKIDVYHLNDSELPLVLNFPCKAGLKHNLQYTYYGLIGTRATDNLISEYRYIDTIDYIHNDSTTVVLPTPVNLVSTLNNINLVYANLGNTEPIGHYGQGDYLITFYEGTVSQNPHVSGINPLVDFTLHSSYFIPVDTLTEGIHFSVPTLGFMISDIEAIVFLMNSLPGDRLPCAEYNLPEDYYGDCYYTALLYSINLEADTISLIHQSTHTNLFYVPPFEDENFNSVATATNVHTYTDTPFESSTWVCDDGNSNRGCAAGEIREFRGQR